MKVCSTCGDTYQDYVDFCFNDGEVLVLAEAGAVGQQLDGAAEGGAAPRRAPATPASMMATPVPRDHRRSAPRGQGAQRPTEPQRTVNVPHTGVSPTATTLTDPDEGEDEPSAASLERTQPIDIASQKGGDPFPRPQGAQAGARAVTLEAEEDDSSRLLVFGIAATLFGSFLLLAAGVLVLGMTTGLVGAGTDTDNVAVVEPLPAPLPQVPLPSLVEPVPAPLPVAEPAPEVPVPLPEPQIASAPVPVPAPVVAPAPVPVVKPATPVPAAPVAPSPVAPVPKAAPVPKPAPTPKPAPAVVEAVALKHPVTLTTDPPGAAVYLGGSKVLAATPGSVELEPGTYTLEARMPNHSSSTASVTVVDGPVSAQFAPLAAIPTVKVTVMWKPGKDYPTSVTVDGAPIACPIPCTTPMTAGSHLLRVTNVDGTSFETPVTIPTSPTYVLSIGP